MERFNRQLKYAPTAATNGCTWGDKLPFVMLELRNTIKQNLKCTSAQLVFGTPLTLPGQIFSNTTDDIPSSNFVSDLKQKMTDVIYTPTRAYHKPYYVPVDLHQAEYVFLCRDTLCKPLTPSYTGPHPVTSKYFVIDIAGKHNTVSIDRLKPAYLEHDGKPLTTHNATHPEPSSIQSIPASDAEANSSTRTRSGRHVHWPAKFKTYFTYNNAMTINMGGIDGVIHTNLSPLRYNPLYTKNHLSTNQHSSFSKRDFSLAQTLRTVTSSHENVFSRSELWSLFS